MFVKTHYLKKIGLILRLFVLFSCHTIYRTNLVEIHALFAKMHVVDL